MAKNDEVVLDDGTMEQNESIKASTKVVVSDGNVTETFSVDINNGVIFFNQMEQNKFINAFTKVSLKDVIVSDGNDTETSSFGVINSENKVKNYNFR